MPPTRFGNQCRNASPSSPCLPVGSTRTSLLPRRLPLPAWLLLATLAATHVAAAPAAPARQEPTHTFTGNNGTALEGTVLSVKDVEVIVKRPDGKTFTLDLPTLTPTDLAYVKKWKATGGRPTTAVATTESDIEIAVTLAPVAAENKTVPPGSFTPKVTLHNRETKVDFSNLKGTLVLIGQSASNPGRFKVLEVEKFSANLTAGGSYDFTGHVCSDAPAQGNQPAYRYRGYFVVLQNAEDNVIQFSRSGPFAKSSAEVLKLQGNQTFTGRPPVGMARPRPQANTSGRKGNWQSLTSVLPLHLDAPPADTAKQH